MRGRAAALLLLAAAMLPLTGRPVVAQPLHARLPNGVTVLVRENTATPIVAASLFVRVGSGWETEDRAGITNLLQALLVKGTRTRSALDIAEAAERIGGGISASADTDFSEIRGAALARHWKGLLELLAEVALRPTLPEAELEGERRAVLSAIRSRQDQPFPLAFDSLMARVYGGHPYGRPTLGRISVVERLDRAALLAHYQRYYRAGRMILAVSGDVSAPEVAAEAGRLLAEAPSGDGGPDPALGSPASSLDRTVLIRPSAQAQVMIGFLAPPLAHADYAAVKVLATALGGGMAGRLFTEVRDKQGLAYSTGGAYASRLGPSVFYAQLGTAPVNRARAEEAMLREIERMRSERLSPGEVARAKAYLLGQFALDRRTNARLAWYDASFEALGVGPGFAERYARNVESVSAEDVQRVAQAYLGSPTIVTLGPGTP